MPLSGLPNELLCSIATNLDQTDLNSFLQTSRQHAYLLNDFLWKREAADPGSRAVHWAAQRGRDSMIELWISYGASLHKGEGSPYCTPMFWAIMLDHQSSARLLLEHGDVSCNTRLKTGEDARLLHTAVNKAMAADLVALMIEKGHADLEIRDNEGLSPLHKAAVHGNVGIMETLVSHGAAVNARDDEGCTPLHRAAAAPQQSDNHVAAARVLLENGADREARNHAGRTALQTAERSRQHSETMLTLLREQAESRERRGSLEKARELVRENVGDFSQCVWWQTDEKCPADDMAFYLDDRGPGCIEPSVYEWCGEDEEDADVVNHDCCKSVPVGFESRRSIWAHSVRSWFTARPVSGRKLRALGKKFNLVDIRPG